MNHKNTCASLIVKSSNPAIYQDCNCTKLNWRTGEGFQGGMNPKEIAYLHQEFDNLREQIAQEIEAIYENATNVSWIEAAKKCAAIARGQK